MNARLFATLTAAFFLCAVAAAQVDNCCFVDRQCSSDQEWTDGYNAFQNGQCAAPAQSQSEAPAQTHVSSQIDNCCFVDRQCNSDADWTDGYHAYQNGQCAAPAQSQSGTTPLHQTNAAGPIDNCCLAGWHCVTDREWQNGRWAFANNVCVHPSPAEARPDQAPSCCNHGWNCTFDFDWIAGRWHLEAGGIESCGPPIQEIVDGVIIEGSRSFVDRVKQAMALIKRRSPEWYAYSITAARKIREGLSSGTLQQSWNITRFHTFDLHWLAAVIVHENCHLQRWLVWVWRDYEAEYLAEEAVCDTVAINALKVIAPGAHYSRHRIEDFLSLGLDYDVHAGAQREWERAKKIYSATN